MKTSTKQTILGWLLAVLAAVLSSLVLLSLHGCTATHSAMQHASVAGSEIQAAQDISQRINDKSVVVRHWLESHNL